MKVFENTTPKQEILITVSMLLAVILVIIVYTNFDREIAALILENNSSMFLESIITFIIRVVLSVMVAVPALWSLCDDIQDNFINTRFC